MIIHAYKVVHTCLKTGPYIRYTRQGAADDSHQAPCGPAVAVRAERHTNYGKGQVKLARPLIYVGSPLCAILPTSRIASKGMTLKPRPFAPQGARGVRHVSLGSTA